MPITFVIRVWIGYPTMFSHFGPKSANSGKAQHFNYSQGSHGPQMMSLPPKTINRLDFPSKRRAIQTILRHPSTVALSRVFTLRVGFAFILRVPRVIHLPDYISNKTLLTPFYLHLTVSTHTSPHKHYMTMTIMPHPIWHPV